jgi:hypothetical protein
MFIIIIIIIIIITVLDLFVSLCWLYNRHLCW